MKNKTMFMLTFLAVLGAMGSSFAAPTLPQKNYNYSGAGRKHTNEVPVGRTSYTKEGGVSVRTIMGEVKSINTEKKLFVVEDKHDGVTATVLTDAQTISSLRPGNIVTVKLTSGSPVAKSVKIGTSESNTPVPVGMVSYSKGTKTITGVVASVNPKKNVFVIEDKRDGITETVVTDSQTIASLHAGQVVRVRLNVGSPIAQSVEINR